MVAAVVLVPALWWAALAIVRADRFWPRPMVAMATALSGPLTLIGLAGDSRVDLATLVVAAGVLLVARIILRADLVTAKGPAAPQ